MIVLLVFFLRLESNQAWTATTLDASFRPSWTSQSYHGLRRPCTVAMARRRDEYVDDDDYYYDEEEDFATRQSKRKPSRRDFDEDEDIDAEDSLYDYYDEEADDYVEESSSSTYTTNDDGLYWETCSCGDAGTAHILLPPASVEKPTAVIHFVGGTFFGSAPQFWYKSFLQDLVQHTNAVVVATSIPVTVGSLWGSSAGDDDARRRGGRSSSSPMSSSSPLNHVALAKKLSRQFQVAWEDVLVDEYGPKALEQVSVCGLGHSLGSRLLVVLATLGGASSKTKPKTRRQRLLAPPDQYKALVLVSFTNYGAAAGIPGIAQLTQASRKLQREASWKKKQQPRKRPSRTTKRSSRKQLEYDYDDDEFWDDDDDDDEEEWGELLDDFKGMLQQQATKLQTALTPNSEALEFHPSPEQLWKAITMDQRYNVSETLLVQFDDDEIDQSAKLANGLLSLSTTPRVNGQEGTTANGDQSSSAPSLSPPTLACEVYFSRIRGTHLTPVVPETKTKQQQRQNKRNLLDKVNSKISKSMVKLLTGQGRQSNNQESLWQLRQVVSSFLIETMVAK